MKLLTDWITPPRNFSVMPFWFWNDALDEAEIVRQIADFEAHGVYGFIIHPRVGISRELEWMSDDLLYFYRVAIEEAYRRKMYVLLYDEGMYPSGSSCGQVVAFNPAFQCRCLAKIDLPDGREPELKNDENLIAIVPRHNGKYMAVIDRKTDSFIRGIHYIGDGPDEDTPPAADILNPQAVAKFIELVHDRFAKDFSQYFGNTILAMFTDEPGVLGKCREPTVVPGTTGILEHVNRILGYDFTLCLPALWYDDEPEAKRFRDEYQRAVNIRLEETYYSQVHSWCEEHGLPLAGHPAKPDDIGVLRYFHIPGQDLVWRWVLPDQPSALEGTESTQGKGTSSAMIHLDRQRNSNECCGAYGHELTWDEMTWLANWCFVRGVNLLYPHAFYYSVRGPRRDERPPDVGPNSSWWDRYQQYADSCCRLSWLNTGCQHVCDIAILGRSDQLPWHFAKVCFEHQRDFNYLEERHLWQDAKVDSDGIHISGMHYRVLILEYEPDPRACAALDILGRSGRIIRYQKEMADIDLVRKIDEFVSPDIRTSPGAPGLRVRHIIKDELHCYILFNEKNSPLQIELDLSVSGNRALFDVSTGQVSEIDRDVPLRLEGHELQVIVINGHLTKTRRVRR